MKKARDEGEGERTAEVQRNLARSPVVSVLWSGGAATFPLPRRAPCLIGRGPDADVAIEARSISRRHAMLFHGDELAVEDLGSFNGTMVRGQLIKPNQRVSVELGEPILIGEAVLIVRPPGTPATPEERRAPARGSDREPSLPPEPLRRRSPIDEVERLVGLVASTTMSVLLLGETGSGKGYFARRVHDLSKRREGPWLHLNCAAIPENLLESELFGYERGAFSGAAQTKPGLLEGAAGGTVFLDEVGDLPVGVQAKLLVAVERGEVFRLGATKPRPIDVRFVSATNKPHDAGGIRGLRSDLYFRLAGLPISIPPLRERTGDIATLAAHFLTEASKKAGRAQPALSAEALEALKTYGWPGNARELATVIERALLWCGDVLHKDDLRFAMPTAGPQIDAPASAPAPAATSKPPTGEPETAGAPALTGRRVEAERRAIIEALEACGGNQSRAAETLGISRRTLISRMISFGLPRPRKG